jgi:hypothetical protein
MMEDDTTVRNRHSKVSKTDSSRAPLQDLVADDADEYDAAHHGEIERAWNPQ